MFVKPVYLKRRYKKPMTKADQPPMLRVKEVSHETRPIGFSPTAVLSQPVVIAR